MAGFATGSDSEPGVEMAGFESVSRRYLPTVSRFLEWIFLIDDRLGWSQFHSALLWQICPAIK
jgi:hypothetical protein